LNYRNKIGLFGGTFNPIHIGHLILAEQAMEELQLDKMIWLPGGDPPHKGKMLKKEERIKMVKMAIASNEKFELSRWELEQTGPSYTFHTLNHFRTIYSNYEICFLMGEDSLRNFKTWYRYQELLKLASFYVAKRREEKEHQASTSVLKELKALGGKVEFLSTPYLDISSTLIRENALKGKSFRYYVPEEVYWQIIKENYYGENQNIFKE